MKKTDSYEKQHRKEKLLIEEKIGLLFDQESFRTLEGGKEEKAGSVVTGYGTIEGRRVYMYAHNSAVKGGTVGLQEGKRIRKLIEEAMRQRRPVVGIQDSGGARIQEGIAALAGYGEVLKAHAAAAGVIPQVMVVAGTCAGGAAYSPGLADFTFIVEETGYMFVTGPDVVEKSCGQKCTWEETGGAGQEQEGMVRHGAKLLFAYAEADTVKLAVILRKAYGGAYICMGSKALGMDAVYAWPGAEIAVMGAECAIPILHKRKLAGMDEEEKQEFIKERTEEYRENLKADVENAVRYGYIDGWLEPDHTREQLIRDLEYYGKRRKTGKRKRKYGLVPL